MSGPKEPSDPSRDCPGEPITNPSRRSALFPNIYTWLVFMSAMDIMLTWIVIYSGGREINALANAVITRWGLPGMVVYKFALIAFVVVLCEIVGRRQPKTGRRFGEWALALTCVPVVFTLVLLTVRRLGM